MIVADQAWVAGYEEDGYWCVIVGGPGGGRWKVEERIWCYEGHLLFVQGYTGTDGICCAVCTIEQKDWRNPGLIDVAGDQSIRCLG